MTEYKINALFSEKPQWHVPPKKGKAGRKPQIEKPNQPSFLVDEYCKALDKEDWREIKVRNTAKGKLKGIFHFQNVFILSKTRNTFEKRLLVLKLSSGVRLTGIFGITKMI